jgi:meiotically up-regulated gene 157 (Mug157) protein
MLTNLAPAQAAPAVPTARNQVKTFDCDGVGEVLLMEDVSRIVPGLLSDVAHPSRLIIPARKWIYEGKTDIFHGGLAHYFEGTSWTDGVGSPGSSLTAAALQTDVNMNSQGTMFEESSKLVLGAEHYNCKERNGKPALRRLDL